MDKKYKISILTPEEIEDGKKIKVIFENLSETGKAMAGAYVSALRDKEVSEQKAG